VKEDRLKRSGHYVGFSDLLSRQKDGAFEVWVGQTILGLSPFRNDWVIIRVVLNLGIARRLRRKILGLNLKMSSSSR